MQTIFLEFKHEAGNIAANGTDVTFYIDGRWSWATTVMKIHERVSALREGPFGSRYRKQLFMGFTHSQHPFYNGKGGAIHTMSDPYPPNWARRYYRGYEISLRGERWEIRWSTSPSVILSAGSVEDAVKMIDGWLDAK